jgi:predicted bacteriocin transport accessory protein
MNEEIKKILKNLLICVYIIILLLVIDTVILFASNVKITTSSDSNNSTEETENTEYDVSMFNAIDGTEAAELFKSEEMQVIYIGRSTCGYCVKFLPNLQKAQSEFGYTTNYLDINTITDEQQSVLLTMDNEDKFLESRLVPGYTPMVLLVKDGKLVDGWVGYAEYDEFAQFLTDNGFSKD